MSDLRNKLRDWRDGMTKLGFPAQNVNWQSIAVLLHHGHEGVDQEVKSRLLDQRGGWWNFGRFTDNHYCSGTSLYLSPKGMVYWLYYGGHSALYYDCMNASQDGLDRAGWLHISGARVDVHCHMTKAQQRWLEGNKPHPESEGTLNGGWRLKGFPGHDAHALGWNSNESPKPYAYADKFDVRPVPDIDLDNDEHWDRLMLRIERAAAGVQD